MKVKSLLKSVTKSGKVRAGREMESDAAAALSEPMRYTVHHLGSMPVDEEETMNGKKYRDGIGASAVRTIVVMAKSAHNKGVAVHLDVTASKVRVQESRSQKVLVDTPIQRICFCTCDGVYNKVFAFIYRVPEKEVMECHSFYCGSPQAAQSLALTMNGAFIAALERERVIEQQLRDAHAFPVSIPVYPTRHRNGTTSSASSSACSSAGSMNSRSARSGSSSSARSGTVSPTESEVDSASVNSTRSANFSANSSASDQMSAAALVDMVAKQFARNMIATRSDSGSFSTSQRSQVVLTVEVHAPPTTVVEPKKCWSSTDDIQNDSILRLRCATNYSCVLPVPAATAPLS